MSCCAPCHPCRSLTRCRSSKCLDCFGDRCCCCHGAGNCCCGASCVPSNNAPCCQPCSYPCRPCRREHIWELCNCVQKGPCKERSPPPPPRPRARSRPSPPVKTPPIKTPPIKTPPIKTPPVKTPPVKTPPAKTPSKKKVRRDDLCAGCDEEVVVITTDIATCPACNEVLISSKVCEDAPRICQERQTQSSSRPRTPPQHPMSAASRKKDAASSIADSSSSHALQQSTSTQAQVSFRPDSSYGTQMCSKSEPPIRNIQAFPVTNIETSLGRYERDLAVLMETSTQTDGAKATPHSHLITQSFISPPLLTPIPHLPSMVHPSTPLTPTALVPPHVGPRHLRQPPLGFMASPPVPPVTPIGLPLMCMPFSVPMGPPKDPPMAVVCPFCGGKGHSGESCSKFIHRKDPAVAAVCPFCGGKGHTGDSCTKFIPRKAKRMTNTRPAFPANPYVEDNSKANGNSVLFIQRTDNTSGPSQSNKMWETWMTPSQGGQQHKSLSRDSRLSRFQRENNVRNVETDPLVPDRNRSRSLRSISSQTSVDLRRLDVSSVCRPSRYLAPRRRTKTPGAAPIKVLVTETASQTWPQKSDIGSQTTTNTENKDDGIQRSFSPHNVFFVATPTVTNAWCRAVCGDQVSEIPSILEKIATAKEKCEMSKKAIELERSISLQRVAIAYSEAAEKDNVRANDAMGNSDRESVKENEMVGNCAGSGNNLEASQKPIPKTMEPFPSQNDLCRKPLSEVKRERTVPLTRMDQSHTRARDRLMKRSSSKVSTGSFPDVKVFRKPSKAQSMQHLNSRPQPNGDVASRAKSNTTIHSAMSDVIMAGPGVCPEKGSCGQLKVQAESQTKGSPIKGKSNQNGNATTAAGSARANYSINKFARRLKSPALGSRRIPYNHHNRTFNNQSRFFSSITKNSKPSDGRNTMNPIVFCRDYNMVQRSSQSPNFSKPSAPEERECSKWLSAVDPTSGMRVSLSPRAKEESIREDEIQNLEYQSVEPNTESTLPCQDIESSQDAVYDVMEVEVPGNSIRNEIKEGFEHASRNACFDMNDRDGRRDNMTDAIGPCNTAGNVLNVADRGIRKLPNDRRSVYQHLSGNVNKLPSVDEEERQSSQIKIDHQENSTECQLHQQFDFIQEFDPLRRQENDYPPRNYIQRSTFNSTEQPKIAVNRQASNHASKEATQHVQRVPNAASRSPRKVSPSPPNGKRSVSESVGTDVIRQSSLRSLESMVQIEDVGPDEVEDYPYSQWSRSVQNKNVPQEKSKTSLSSGQAKDNPRNYLRGSNVAKKASKASVRSVSPQKPDMSSTRWESPQQMSRPPQIQTSATSKSPAAAPIVLHTPPTPSVDQMNESSSPLGLSETTQSGERRVARHEYYTTPPNYGTIFESTNVGIQALPHPYHSSDFSALSGTPRQTSEEVTPQQCGMLSPQKAQACVQQSRYQLSSLEPQPPVDSCHDRLIPFEKVDETGRTQRWKLSRGGPPNPRPISQDGFRAGGQNYRESSPRKVSRHRMESIDYGPEVPMDSRRLDEEIDHCHKMIRRCDDRSYAEDGEKMLPTWKGSRHKSKSYAEPRGEKKRKEYYYEIVPAGRDSSKPHCQMVTLRPADRDDARVKEKYERSHRHGGRKLKEDRMMYEEDEYAGDSDVEYLRRWKLGQIASRSRYGKSSRSNRYHGHTSSKLRVMTPQTPMTSSSYGPWYHPHHYRVHSHRDSSYHSHRGLRRRSSKGKWDL